MRWYKGKKRLAKKLLGKQLWLIKWALTIKPGDYIATCEGCNRKVTEVEYDWINEGLFRRGKKNKTRVICEVRFTDTNGQWHNCPGGGCAYPAETPEQVTAYFKEITTCWPEKYEKMEVGTFATDPPKIRGVKIVKGYFEDSLTPQLAALAHRSPARFL